MRWRYTLPLLIFFLLGLLLWMGIHQQQVKVDANVIVGEPMPNFNLPDVMKPQERVSNKSFQGKVILLNVWATWCMSCRAEHPVLLKIAKTHHVPIYGLDFKDNAHSAQKFLRDEGNPYVRTGFDEEGYTAISLGVYGTPETYIIDKQGIIRYRHVGTISWKLWENTIWPKVQRLQQAEG